MILPVLNGEVWMERPDNPRAVIIWEHFDQESILEDFFRTMQH